jgi:hypothetical protein
MKRTQLIEYGLVIIGIIIGYKFLEGLIFLVTQLFERPGPYSKSLINYLLFSVVYLFAFILLLRNSRRIARWLNGSAENDTLPLKVSKESLLQVALIAICILTVLSHIAEILLYIFQSFKKEVQGNRGSDSDISEFRFKMAAIQSGFAIIILCFSQQVSSWFIRKDDLEKLSFDSTVENK